MHSCKEQRKLKNIAKICFHMATNIVTLNERCISCKESNLKPLRFIASGGFKWGKWERLPPSYPGYQSLVPRVPPSQRNLNLVPPCCLVAFWRPPLRLPLPQLRAGSVPVNCIIKLVRLRITWLKPQKELQTEKCRTHQKYTRFSENTDNFVFCELALRQFQNKIAPDGVFFKKSRGAISKS